MAIWFTSDWHLNHDREFIWKARRFNSIEEMNKKIISRHNEVITPSDELYILGDLMLGSDNKSGLEFISQVNGYKHIILGNHDTRQRKDLYQANGYECLFADTLRYNGYNFYLSHYPTITSNLEKESLKQCIINLYGHTHQTTNFYNDIPFCYHVGVDSHYCFPVEINDIIKEIKEKVKECEYFL